MEGIQGWAKKLPGGVKGIHATQHQCTGKRFGYPQLLLECSNRARISRITHDPTVPHVFLSCVMITESSLSSGKYESASSLRP